MADNTDNGEVVVRSKERIHLRDLHGDYFSLTTRIDSDKLADGDLIELEVTKANDDDTPESN